MTDTPQQELVRHFFDAANADAFERLAVLAYRRRDLAAAIRYGRQAIAADPARGTAVSNPCFHSMFACDWGTLPELGRRLDAFTDKALAAGQAPAETPHLSLIRTHDPARRQRLHERLERARHHEPLFDTWRYVRHLETAIIAAWNCHSRGARPREIRVGSDGAANRRVD